jgi:cellulose synthase (UDP-forming)
MGKYFTGADPQSREPPIPAGKSSGSPPLYGLIVIVITLLCVYVIFRGSSLFNPGYRLIDHIFAILLLAAEAFIIFHGIGYLATVIRVNRSQKAAQAPVFTSYAEPYVAVIVASFNEDPAMLEDTLVSVANLDYTNKHLYLLDDSTNEDMQKGAQALAEKYGYSYVHRATRRGYKAGALNDLLKGLDEKYLAIFDADQKPVYNFLREIVPILEEEPKLAFVQTPQYYANTEYSPVARGAFYQQAIFYEYICEGKDTTNAVFCCGTNVVFLTQALRSIGGFDESTVTEDFATSLRCHLAKWKSLYYNRVSVSGLGPETLAGYFTQQTRWATGTIGTLKKVVAAFLRKPTNLKLGQWWEYSLSGSYYLIGWANLILMVCPIVYVLFGVRPLIASSLYYLAAFVPYFIVSLYVFYLSMGIRGYRPRDLFRGQAIGFISFWAHITASVAAALGKQRTFGVTPKGAAGRLPLRYLAPHITLFTLSLVAVVIGIYRVVAMSDYATLVNVIWATYHIVLLGSMFYFNRSFRGYPDTHIFRDWSETEPEKGGVTEDV